MEGLNIVDNAEKIVLTYSKQHLINEIANKMNVYPDSIKEVYNTLEEIINAHLLEADVDKDVSIKLMEGIRLESKIIPEHYHTHPLMPYSLVPEKIKIWCKITPKFKKKKQEEYTISKSMLNEYLERRKTFSEIYESEKSGGTTSSGETVVK